MKKLSKIKLSLLALAGALAVSFPGIGQTTVYAAETTPGFINVSGTGYVNIVPDVAYVTLGVSTVDANPKTAQEKNNEQIAKVIDAVKGLGIEDADIKTTNFYMYPNYDYATGKGETITGYTVSNNVTVTVRDIDQVGDVLSATADAGANTSSGVEFGLLDSSAAYHEAMAQAIANAADKAETIAEALGRTIGAPTSVVESGGMYAPVYQAAGMNMAARDAAVSSVPVQAGELTVTANVQVSYEYAR